MIKRFHVRKRERERIECAREFFVKASERENGGEI